MTYVTEQTSEQLAAHMRMLQAMPGWHEPLADRLWVEVQRLQADLESHKRMLLAACVGFGAVGEALGADSEDDASEIEGLAVELRKDAERYRFMRDEADVTPGAMPMAYMVDENGFPIQPIDALIGEELDAAIDASMPDRCQHGESGSCEECQAEGADERRAQYAEYYGSVL